MGACIFISLMNPDSLQDISAKLDTGLNQLQAIDFKVQAILRYFESNSPPLPSREETFEPQINRKRKAPKRLDIFDITRNSGTPLEYLRIYAKEKGYEIQLHESVPDNLERLYCCFFASTNRVEAASILPLYQEAQRRNKLVELICFRNGDKSLPVEVNDGQKRLNIDCRNVHFSMVKETMFYDEDVVAKTFFN